MFARTSGPGRFAAALAGAGLGERSLDNLQRDDEDADATRQAAIAGVIVRITDVLDELDALGMATAAAHVSLGLDLVRSVETRRPG